MGSAAHDLLWRELLGHHARHFPGLSVVAVDGGLVSQTAGRPHGRIGRVLRTLHDGLSGFMSKVRPSVALGNT